MTSKKKIGIVTPCYNEEDTVAECHATVKALFAGPLAGYDYEHLFCDNCSTDATLERLRAIAKADPNVRVCDCQFAEFRGFSQSVQWHDGGRRGCCGTVSAG